MDCVQKQQRVDSPRSSSKPTSALSTTVSTPHSMVLDKDMIDDKQSPTEFVKKMKSESYEKKLDEIIEAVPQILSKFSRSHLTIEDVREYEDYEEIVFGQKLKLHHCKRCDEYIYGYKSTKFLKHMNAHYDVKPYECAFKCGMRFS